MKKLKVLLSVVAMSFVMVGYGGSETKIDFNTFNVKVGESEDEECKKTWYYIRVNIAKHREAIIMGEPADHLRNTSSYVLKVLIRAKDECKDNTFVLDQYINYYTPLFEEYEFKRVNGIKY